MFSRRNGETFRGGEDDDQLVGGEGDDTLYGAGGNDKLDGRGGDDLIIGGPGADMLKGGDGEDTASYEQARYGVAVDLQRGRGSGSDASGDTFTGMKTIVYEDAHGSTQMLAVADIENLRGSQYFDILGGNHDSNRLDGLGGADRLYGLGGNDYLNGGEGDDFLEGGPGADTFRGGAGVDYAFYEDSSAGVEVNLHDGVGRGGDAEGDTFAGKQTIKYTDTAGEILQLEISDIEALVGSGYDDVLVGDHGANTLSGGAGNDDLYGGEGNDLLVGGAGRDILEGGSGADELRGGADQDTASYRTSGAGVVVRLHNVLERGGRGGDAEGDAFAGRQTIEYTDDQGNLQAVEVPDIEHLTGSYHNDILAGDIRDNRLAGFAGDDLLYGGPDGGNDTLVGGDGNDRLYGGKGNDTLEGGFGDDLLRGGKDDDTLTGGAGGDIFGFAPGGGGDDTILDFRNGADKIDLTAFKNIGSIDDLVVQQQQSSLVIDLSSQGGGTITLQDFNETNAMDIHFIFFVDDLMAMV